MGENELCSEAKIKYDQILGSAKVNFLALNKKSRKRLLNAYFRDSTSEEKMDNLMSRLQLYRIFKQ